ncbi:hypothetical protein CEXT_689631, partial [Caerostris extrusa]
MCIVPEWSGIVELFGKAHCIMQTWLHDPACDVELSPSSRPEGKKRSCDRQTVHLNNLVTAKTRFDL